MAILIVQSVCKTCKQFQLNAANWYSSVRVLPWDVFNASSPSHPQSLSPSIPQLLSVSSVPLSFLSPSAPHSHSPSILESFIPSFTPSLHSLLSRQFQMEFWCWLRSFIAVSCGLDVGCMGWGGPVTSIAQQFAMSKPRFAVPLPVLATKVQSTRKNIQNRWNLFSGDIFFNDVIIETYFLTTNNILFWPCSGIVRWKSSVIVVAFKDTGPVSGPAGCFIVI